MRNEELAPRYAGLFYGNNWQAMDSRRFEFWVWMDTAERVVSEEFKSKSEALANPPKGYVLCNDAWQRIGNA